MNSHATPRTAFQGRSLGGSGLPPQSRQPVAPQVSSNEDYSTIPEEDREHIDEVVGWVRAALRNSPLTVASASLI
jgi:centrin-3